MSMNISVMDAVFPFKVGKHIGLSRSGMMVLNGGNILVSYSNWTTPTPALYYITRSKNYVRCVRMNGRTNMSYINECVCT